MVRALLVAGCGSSSTSGGGGADVLGGKGLRDGDEADGCGIAPGPAGGAREAIAHTGQPRPERDGIDHYFLYCATMALAVAALSPSGASFKYVSNSGTDSAILPSLTNAMPSQ